MIFKVLNSSGFLRARIFFVMFNTNMIINVFKYFFTKQIQDSMTNDIETGIVVIDEWELIQNTIFTEPVWGKILNK